MPEYDPDAEVSSLAFTIPSWCSTIRRAMHATNLQKVSSQAKTRLAGQLETLKSQAEILLKYLEESMND